MISTKTAVLAPNRDLALVPPEYGVVVLTTRPRRSVWRSIVWYVGGRKPDVPGYCSINFMRTKWTVHVSVQFVWRSCRSVTVCRWYCVMFHHIVPRSALHVIKLQENAGLSVLLKTWISSSCFTLQRSQYCEIRLRFVMYLSVRMEQLGAHGTDFQEISYWGFFENLSRKCNFY